MGGQGTGARVLAGRVLVAGAYAFIVRAGIVPAAPSVPPDPAVPQQHRRQPLLRPLTVRRQRRPDPDEVPHRLLGLGRYPDRGELADPVQPG